MPEPPSVCVSNVFTVERVAPIIAHRVPIDVKRLEHRLSGPRARNPVRSTMAQRLQAQRSRAPVEDVMGGFSFRHAFLGGLAVFVAACAQGTTIDEGGVADQTPNGSGTTTAVCGDAVCASTEGCASCPDDCVCDTCGDQVCGLEEACDTCEPDCGPCNTQNCGNAQCDAGETAQNCPQDCGSGTAMCGDASCDAPETEQSCPQDCGSGSVMCGDQYCDPPETEQTCPADCGSTSVVCGDQYCDPPETAQTCPSDCGQQGGNCTHSACDEGDVLDPSCDPCAAIVCQFDPYCCQTAWDGQCVGEASYFCGCP